MCIVGAPDAAARVLTHAEMCKCTSCLNYYQSTIPNPNPNPHSPDRLFGEVRTGEMDGVREEE